MRDKGISLGPKGPSLLQRAAAGTYKTKYPPSPSPNNRSGAAINGNPRYNNSPLGSLAIAQGRLNDLSRRLKKGK